MHKLLLPIYLSFSLTNAYAGTMGRDHVDSGFGGFYAGFGAGLSTLYSNPSTRLSLSNGINLISASPHQITSGLLLTGNVGYGTMFSKQNYLGVKGSIYYMPGTNSVKADYFPEYQNSLYFTEVTTLDRTLQPYYNIDVVLGTEILPNFMPFIEGGVSFANPKVNYQTFAVVYTPTISKNYTQSNQINHWNTGFNVGVGANYRVKNNWYVFSELLYNNFGSYTTKDSYLIPGNSLSKITKLTQNNQLASLVLGASYLFT